MSDTRDGGPAFPLSKEMAVDPVTNMRGEDVSSGMSLRDYFAAAALPCIIADTLNSDNESDPHDSASHPRDRIAARCFAIADAMLKAREAPHGK